MSFCYFVLGILSQYHISCSEPESWVSTVTLIFAIISKMFITTALCVLFTQAAELFPVEIRSIGWGICSTSFDLGGCFAPFFLKLDNLVSGLPLFLMSGFCLISGSVAMTLPETRGMPLILTINEAKKFYKENRKTVFGMRL